MTDRQKKAAEMVKKGERFAKLLPKGYRLLGVDPGYLFTGFRYNSFDLNEEVVDSILKHLDDAKTQTSGQEAECT